jgi:hypothetical protein
MTHENLLARIQKMLALSKSAQEIGSVEEAATAASLAQKLMVENKIEMADLADLGEDEIPIFEYDVLAEEGGKSPRAWKWDLLVGIANNNFCNVLKWGASFQVGQRPGTGMSRGKLMLFGKKPDVEAVLYMYRWLVKEVDKLAKRAGKTQYDSDTDGSKRTWMDCFRKGAATEIDIILTLKRREQEKHLRSMGKQTTVLVKADSEVTEYVESKFKICHRQRSVSNWSDSGYNQGTKAARSINLDSGVGLQAPAKQLKGDGK